MIKEEKLHKSVSDLAIWEGVRGLTTIAGALGNIWVELTDQSILVMENDSSIGVSNLSMGTTENVPISANPIIIGSDIASVD